MKNKKVINAFFPRNRRGQEGMSITAVIGIILGIVVLVVLVLGFTIGWNKFLPFIFSSNNVENIKTTCSTACATNNEYDYCTLNRTLKAEDLPKIDGKVPKSVKGSCNSFVTNTAYTQYGIERCPQLENEATCQSPSVPSAS